MMKSSAPVMSSVRCPVAVGSDPGEAVGERTSEELAMEELQCVLA